MKKIICFFLVSSLFSCSKNDVENHIITLAEQCGGGLQTEYCVTESTYQDILEIVRNGEPSPCIMVGFEDRNGNTRAGYFITSNISSGDTNCS